MSIYDKIDYSGDRPTIPSEELEDFPRSFIPPLKHYYEKNIALRLHHWDSSDTCKRCGRVECSNCFYYCPWCGGSFEEDKEKKTDGEVNNQ